MTAYYGRQGRNCSVRIVIAGRSLPDGSIRTRLLGISGVWIIIATVVVFWAISHLMDSRDPQRAAWPAIIMAMGAANLGNMIIQWITPVYFGFLGSQTVPADVIVTLTPAPVLLIAGGIFGFVAVQHQRKISSLGIHPSN